MAKEMQLWNTQSGKNLCELKLSTCDRIKKQIKYVVVF